MSLQTIACDRPIGVLAWKHPSDSLTLGSQIIVNESQEALLFENGLLVTALGPGRHPVSSGSIPGLEGVIARTFGGASPLLLQVWFLNKACLLDCKWGLQIQVRDPQHGLLVPLGIRGSYGLQVRDAASFLLQMVGVNREWSADQLRACLLPLVERAVKDHVSTAIVSRGLDLFTLTTQTRAISAALRSDLSGEFERFGLSIVDFYVQGIDVISDDPAFAELRRSLAQAAGLRVRANAASEVGGFYQLERQLDALNAAASHDGGASAVLLSGGLGVGVGLGLGQQMAQNLDQSTPPQPAAADPLGPLRPDPQAADAEILRKLKQLKSLLASELISEADYRARSQVLLDQL